MLTSVGCFGGSRAVRPVLELLRKGGLQMYIGLRMLAFRDDVRSIRKIALSVRLGWLAPAKRVAGSSDLTVTPNSSTFLCSLLFDKICIICWNAHAIIITSCFSIN